MNERYKKKRNVTLRLPVEILDYAKNRADVQSREQVQRVSVNSILMAYIVESYENDTNPMYGAQSKLNLNRRIANAE